MRDRAPLNHTLGAKLGPRVAAIVVEALKDHAKQTEGHKARIVAEGANEFFRGMSREKRQHTTPMWEQYLGHPDTPPELEAVLRFIATGQGELSEIMGSLGMGQAVGTAVMSGISDWLAPLNQAMMQGRPNNLLDPSAAAGAHAAGLMDENSTSGELAKQGLNGRRAEIMMKLALQFPGLPELLELWRRGAISEGGVILAMERQGIPHDYRQPLLSLKREHLGPADAALGVLRGIISEGEGEAIAAVGGLNVQDFHTLIGNTGEPPGLMQMLEGYRRGFLSQGELQKGIRQSRVRNEWIPLVEKLRYQRASAADAVNAVVQGHLTDAQAREVAQEAGLNLEDFGWLVENAGNPIAPMQAAELYNRGVISKARFEEAVREGRTKDKYIQNVFALRVKLPPMFQTVKMLATGSITPQRGAEILLQEGYEHDVVTGMVHAATSEQSGKARALAVAQITELYEELAFTKDEAIAKLGVLGLTPANARLVLHVADLKRERKLIDAAMAPIRTQYVDRHIDETEASVALDKIGLAPGQRDLHLHLWAIDRSATKKILTPAQVIAANKLGLISDSNSESRLIQHGYTLEDARILLDSEKGRTHAAP